MPAPAIAASVSTLGSVLNSNAQKNATKANASAQGSIDDQLVSIYNSLMQNYNQINSAVNPGQTFGQAKTFFGNEVTGGLDPAVSGAANSAFQLNNDRTINTIRNSLGPQLPNLAGSIKDFGENAILGNVQLQQGLAAQNQGVRQQGAAGLAGIADSVLGAGTNLASLVSGGLGGLGAQFGAAKNAAAGGPNPFSSIAALLAGFPNIFNRNTSNTTTNSPGQGGLGTVGGLGPSGGTVSAGDGSQIFAGT